VEFLTDPRFPSVGSMGIPDSRISGVSRDKRREEDKEGRDEDKTGIGIVVAVILILMI